MVDSSRANHLGDAKGNHLIYNRSRSSPRLTVISNTLNQLMTRLQHQETKTSSLNLSHTRQMLSIKSRVLHPMARTPLTRSLRTKITTYTQSMYVSIEPELDSNVNSGTPSSLSMARSTSPSSSQATLFTEKRIVYDLIIINLITILFLPKSYRFYQKINHKLN